MLPVSPPHVRYNNVLRIIIGSTNPIKQAAVENVLGQIFPTAHFSALKVLSGVPDQPWGNDETQRGAFQRAQAILTHSEAEIGVGLEGGVMETPYGLFTCAWCVMIRRDGITGIGGGANMLLPPTVAQAVRSGVELGLAIDALVGEQNTKQREGAIGVLTDGLLNRQQAYENIIQLAAAPFRRPEFYRGESFR